MTKDKKTSSSLIEGIMDLLKEPAYIASSTRLDGLLTLIEIVVQTLQFYVSPEERQGS